MSNSMEQVMKVTKQARENTENLKSYITDLKNWEAEMKRKESALNGEIEQELPPVRSKIKREKPVIKTIKPEQKIKSSDYAAWDRFDVDKACEQLDMEDKGPTSLDSKRSSKDKLEKLREEAQYEKEKGNNFVKMAKWNDAISSYTRAVELYSNDAIYYANRALCYLKLDKPTLAEKDCSKALELDPTYVKALQRRASARWKLGSLKAAASDARAALNIEPGNPDALDLLTKLNKQMGTKGPNTKSSPTSPGSPKQLVEEVQTPEAVPEYNWDGADWEGGGDASKIVPPVDKPPYMRSKKPLRKIPIKEIPLGCKAPIVETDAPPTRLKIVEINGDEEIKTSSTIPQETTKLNGESCKIDSVTELNSKVENKSRLEIESITESKALDTSKESQKLRNDLVEKEKYLKNNIGEMKAPSTSVQFLVDWKDLSDDCRVEYLKLIDPEKLPRIFQSSLESEILNEIIDTLNKGRDQLKPVWRYLDGLSRVPRLSTLVMFMESKDKKVLSSLVHFCNEEEKCDANVINALKNKFEI